jgi:hypothetical protein
MDCGGTGGGQGIVQVKSEEVIQKAITVFKERIKSETQLKKIR